MSFNRKSALIRVGEDGRSASIVWTGNAKRGVGGVHSAALVDAGYVYACGQNGRFACVRLADGERVWTTYEPAVPRGARQRSIAWGNVFAIRHGERYFLANDVGELIIARLSPSGYEELDRTKLIDPTHRVGSRTLVWSHPAFANRSVYARNDGELRCYSLSSSP